MMQSAFRVAGIMRGASFGYSTAEHFVSQYSRPRTAPPSHSNPGRHTPCKPTCEYPLYFRDPPIVYRYTEVLLQRFRLMHCSQPPLRPLIATDLIVFLLLTRRNACVQHAAALIEVESEEER